MKTTVSVPTQSNSGDKWLYGTPLYLQSVINVIKIILFM